VDPRAFTSCQEYLGEHDLQIAVRQGTCPLDFTLASFDMPVVMKLVLKREKLEGAMMLRLKNWELPLIVSEQLKDILEESHTTGIAFLQLIL
jgi:hypothetical protein